MQTAVLILRDLWRGRLFVALFAVIAIVAGGLISYKPSLPPESRKYEVGVANVRILLDTPASQVVAITEEAGGDLGGHASLLAQLMTEGEAKTAIAKRAGIKPDDLVTVAPAAGGEKAAKPPGTKQDADILTIKTLTNDAGAQLPFIDVEAEAVDPQRASALANAAVTGLGDFLSSKAAAQQVPDRRRLEARALSTAQGGLVTHGPGLLLAIVASVFTFGLLCGLLLFIYAIARHWDPAVAVEGEPVRPAPIAALAPPPPEPKPAIDVHHVELPSIPASPEPVPSSGRTTRRWSDPPA